MAALRSLALGLALVGLGCGSFIRPDSPRTVRPGGTEIMFAPTVYVGRKDNNGFNHDIVARWGISDRTDVGLRFWLVGASTDVKFQLVRSADPTRGIDVAIAPSVGWGQDISWERSSSSSSSSSSSTSAQAWQGTLPLLVGINFGELQLAITPQLLYQRTNVLPDGILNVGGTLAFGRMSGRGFSVYPLVAVWKSADPRTPIASLGRGELAVQPGAVFRWGF
jgi:hypothetical protein